MKKTLRIDVIIGNDIRTRARIHELERRIQEGNEYILDFSNVHFISRSFADELLSFMERSTSPIVYSNANREISQMLTIVRSNRNLPNVVSQPEAVLHLNTVKQVMEFFDAM